MKVVLVNTEQNTCDFAFPSLQFMPRMGEQK